MRRREVFGWAGAALAAPRLAHAQADQVLRFVPQADLAVLDPLATTTYVTRDHGFLVFDTLYGIDETFDPQPQMLEGHIIEQDGLLWRMVLREGLRFHDGTPVLARDAVASIRRWLQRDAFGLDLTPIIDEISAPTDRELRFRLKRPFPLLPAVLGKANSNMLGIMPERLALTDPLRQVTEMIGSGPFRYLAGERVSGSRNVYERFDGYVPRPTGTPSFLAGPKIPYLQRVEWRTMPDPGTASAALQAGEVDWWAQPIPDLVARLRTNRNIRTEILDAEGYLALIRFNHLHPPFDNPALRRALLLAIDQSDVMTAAAGEDRSMWRAGIGYFTPGPMASDAGMSVLQGPRDLAKAREAVQASGYRGERIVFMAPTDYYSINAMSEVVADTLRRIGLNIDYQGMDWGTMVQRWNSRQPLENGGWSAFVTTTSAIGCITPLEHRSLRGTGLRGPQGWPTNPKFEELRDEFLATTDASRQRAICVEMQEEGFRHVPYLPLGVFYQPTAWRRNVTGQLPGFNRFWNVRKT